MVQPKNIPEPQKEDVAAVVTQIFEEAGRLPANYHAGSSVDGKYDIATNKEGEPVRVERPLTPEDSYLK